jgi:hypothetical protein
MEQDTKQPVPKKLRESNPIVCPHCGRSNNLRTERFEFEAFGKPMSGTVVYCVFDDFYFTDDVYSEFS